MGLIGRGNFKQFKISSEEQDQFVNDESHMRKPPRRGRKENLKDEVVRSQLKKCMWMEAEKENA